MQADAALLEALEAALARDLPTPVETLLVQSDLTAVVPGCLVLVLVELFERAGAVESRIICCFLRKFMISFVEVILTFNISRKLAMMPV